MKILLTILTYLLAAFLIFGGVNHFIKPEFYDPFIPDFMPKLVVNYMTGIIEFLFGLGLLVPSFREMSALGVFILMIVFLPIHVVDVFSESPAIGSKQAAYIRLPFQFLFMAWSWWIWKKSKRVATADK